MFLDQEEIRANLVLRVEKEKGVQRDLRDFQVPRAQWVSGEPRETLDPQELSALEELQVSMASLDQQEEQELLVRQGDQVLGEQKEILEQQAYPDVQAK